MFARARYKLDIDDKVIQAGRFDNKSTQEEQEEFLVSQIINPYAEDLVTDPFCSARSWKPIRRKRMKKLVT